MIEQALFDYFSKKISGKTLSLKIRNMLEDEEGDDSAITYPEGVLEISSNHLVQVCDDVLAGHIPPAYCEHIGFELVTSKCFEFAQSDSGNAALEVAEDWDHADEKGHKLTPQTILQNKKFLLA